MVQPHQGTSLGPEMEGRLTQAASWLDPEDVTPSEISWSREDKEHTTPRTCGPRRHVTETGRRGGRRALAGLHGGMLTFNGRARRFCKMKRCCGCGGQVHDGVSAWSAPTCARRQRR